MSWGVKEDKTQLNKYSTEQKNVKELNQGIPKEIKDIRLQHNVILANTIERPKVSLLSKTSTPMCPSRIVWPKPQMMRVREYNIHNNKTLTHTLYLYRHGGTEIKTLQNAKSQFDLIETKKVSFEIRKKRTMHSNEHKVEQFNAHYGHSLIGKVLETTRQ